MSARNFIEQDLGVIEESQGLERHHLFSIWTVSTFHFDGDLSEATVGEIYQQTYSLLEDGSAGDDCLDGFFYDGDTETLYLYQTKWPDKADKVLSASDVREVATALTALNNDLMNDAAVGGARGEALLALRQVIERKGKVVLRCVTSGKAASNSVDQLRKASPNIPSVEIEHQVYDLTLLLKLIGERNQDLASQKFSFKFYRDTPDAFLTFPKKGNEGYGDSHVVLLSALDLASISHQLGDKLFQKNVRLFLGKGRVNKDMKETLEDPSQRATFWYGHNGITVVGDAVRIQVDAGQAIGLEIENPQIVNGCQTATTLRNVFGASEQRAGIDDFPLLARVIGLTGDRDVREEIAETIAFRTNSQSAVNDADLRANDPQQRLLQKNLDGYGKRWFYERKRGEWKNLAAYKKNRYKSNKNQDRLINKETYQQAWRAFTGAPASAISNKNDVWRRESGGGKDLYELVFSPDRRPCDVVLVATLFDWFSQVFTITRQNKSSLVFDIYKGLDQHAGPLSAAKMLVVAHSVALFGELVKEAFGDYVNMPEDAIDQLVSKLKRGQWVKKTWVPKGQAKSWGVLEPSMKRICMTWANYLLRLKADEGTLYASLKRPKEEAFDDLLEIFRTVNEGDSREQILDPLSLS